MENQYHQCQRQRSTLASVREALMAIGEQGKTIVIDEAHLLFPHRNVVALLTKGLEGKKNAPKTTGSSAVMPNAIRNKYMRYPPVPNFEKLMGDLMNATRPIHLTAESVHFFIRLCGGHRGIFMHAMNWVQECQNNTDDSDDINGITRWGIRD